MGMPGPPHGKGGKPSEEGLGEFYGIIKSYNPEKGGRIMLLKVPQSWPTCSEPQSHPSKPFAGFGFIACDALKNQHEGDVYLNTRRAWAGTETRICCNLDPEP